MVKLFILGLLKKGPSYGYEIRQVLEEGGYAYWTTILPNSIYSALKSLEKNNYIQEERTEYNGQQAKVIYSITDAGKTEFRTLLARHLSQYKRCVPSDIYMSFSYITELPEDEVIELIDSRIVELKKDITKWEEARKWKVKDGSVYDALDMIFQNGITHLKTDFELLQYTRDHLKEIRSSMLDTIQQQEV